MSEEINNTQSANQVKPQKKKIGCLSVIGIIAIIIVVVAIIGALSGDDKPTKEANGDSPKTTTSTTVGDEKFGLNETAVFENIKVTATKIEESKGNEFIKPEKGNIFVGVNFTIENISNEEQSMSSLLLFDAYIDGVKTEYSLSANTAFNKGTLDGALSAGKKMVGYYAVEAPKDWKEISLEVKSEWLSSSKAEFVFKNK